MSNIKLNSNRCETKSDRIKRNNTLKDVVGQDRSLLRPAEDLSEFSKTLFKTIKDDNKQLSNSDNYLLNLLCSEYDLFIKMNEHIRKKGVIDSKGKQSAQYMVLKATVNQIVKLSSNLQITPKDRINSDYHDQDRYDPLREAVK